MIECLQICFGLTGEVGWTTNILEMFWLSTLLTKKKYNRPLVIFSGSNNHKQTTIFGFGLVLDETIASYTWLLKSLLEVMCQKMPSVVVTDGDEAMREAVRVVFPRATHRLCGWHFEKNVTSNVKDAALRARFNRWLYADIAVNEFLTEWSQAVEEFSLQDSLWANQVFGKKEMWANAYLRDKFCAGIRTTSRCEGINSVAKNFLQSKHGMLELVQNLELMVRDYRNNELLVQFRSIDSVPVMTTSLESLERCAASVYTHAIFGDVRNEIVGVASVNLVRLQRSLTTKIYTMDEYGQPGREIVVLYDKNMGRMKCGCNFWNKYGYPCKHMFFVMKHEHLPNIPNRLVLKRWTKNAKALEAYEEKIDVGADQACLLHHGALHSACHWLFFLGSQKYDLFQMAMKGIRNLCAHLEGYVATEDNVFSTKGDGVIRDPVAVRTKGAPKSRNCRGRKRRCTECRNPGHTKRRYPRKKTSHGMEMEDGCTTGFDSDALEEIKMFNHMEEFGDDAVVGANYDDEVAQCTNEGKACHTGIPNMDMLGVGANNYVSTQTSAADAQRNENDEALLYSMERTIVTTHSTQLVLLSWNRLIFLLMLFGCTNRS
ncbi:protein FAR-RED ELONGATED HYPOCOTYL 3 isoform X1 [Arachis ipaensis]|uniref:protein FAR-RED ELONGATED HYPOCOTYL 3 isoform X1 n=1 Tax=Arachis ipaensis TaxID=130454 RepID=UPI000A2B3019|nr:protein FAR-RED ELONGATED HYPOCOTYL 3 isoform X1 [Arachis ipaensis]XP_025680041.1 protein FAR-RED ELONGATED HYPOCOTYL 3 isoform X1 [Arachis hypogaea]